LRQAYDYWQDQPGNNTYITKLYVLICGKYWLDIYSQQHNSAHIRTP